MKSVQLLRNRGYSLHPDEESLVIRLKSMERDLEKPAVFRGRLNEIMASVMQLLDSNIPQESYDIVNADSLKPVFQVLQVNQRPLQICRLG